MRGLLQVIYYSARKTKTTQGITVHEKQKQQWKIMKAYLDLQL